MALKIGSCTWMVLCVQVSMEDIAKRDAEAIRTFTQLCGVLQGNR